MYNLLVIHIDNEADSIVRAHEMKQPIEPSKEDCCNSGCNPCIFDVYEKELKKYKYYLEHGELSASTPSENAISQLEYTPFSLVQSIQLCDSHKLLAFKKNVDTKIVWWKPGDHFLYKYASGDFACTRAYTPIKQKLNENHDFCIIIKKYNGGRVSNHLYSLSIGDQTLWRGPYGSYEVIPNKFDRIIMIAQGTGIAPFFSIIENILGNEDDMTKIVLYYCCENDEQILLRDELYSFKSFWNFTYKIFLSHTIKYENYKYQEPVIDQKLTFEDLLPLKPFLSKDQFLLCGSSQFMKAYDDHLKQHDLQNIIMF